MMVPDAMAEIVPATVGIIRREVVWAGGRLFGLWSTSYVFSSVGEMSSERGNGTMVYNPLIELAGRCWPQSATYLRWIL